MNVLIIGSGGREHALAWKLAQSARVDHLFVAPGNGGTGAVATNIDLDADDHAAIIDFCREQHVNLVVVGPEVPLVNGLVDALQAANIKAFGPTKAAAQLEGSKSFTKLLCDEMNIPTAAYGRFSTEDEALAYVRQQGAPIVIKADGLAAGKGVTVALSLDEAEAAIRDCFAGTFGQAGAEVVIEEFLDGEEASIFALTDGKDFITLASAQDHKRAFDGDLGPNTGGMGAYSPAPCVTPEILASIENEIIAPTVAGMARRGTPFRGVLYAGLMLTKKGPKLIEYNARFGDPECQVLMLRLESDLLDLLMATIDDTIATQKPLWSKDAALTVVMAANGYPGSYKKGSEISGFDDAQSSGSVVFHAGTQARDGKILAAGGRVLNVTARGKLVSDAQKAAYGAVAKIQWPDGFFRRDIGSKAINREH